MLCLCYVQIREMKEKKDLDHILELNSIKKSRSNALKLNELHLWLRVSRRKEQRWLKLCKPVGLAALVLQLNAFSWEVINQKNSAVYFTDKKRDGIQINS